MANQRLPQMTNQDLIDELERRGVLGAGDQHWTHMEGDAPARVIRQDEYERLTEHLNAVGIIGATMTLRPDAKPYSVSDAVRTYTYRVQAAVRAMEAALGIEAEGDEIQRLRFVADRLKTGLRVADGSEIIPDAIAGPALIVRREP